MVRWLLPLTLLFTVLGTSAAQEKKFEITPYVGHRFGGDFVARELDLDMTAKDTTSFGVIVDYAFTSYAMLEFNWSHQNTQLDVVQPVADQPTQPGTDRETRPLFDISIDYFQGGILLQGGSNPLRPFFVFSLGGTSLDPQAEGVSGATKFSLSFGGGLKGFIVDRFGYRVELRRFTTFTGGTSDEEFCDIHGCVTYTSANTFWQGQFSAGLVIAF